MGRFLCVCGGGLVAGENIDTKTSVTDIDIIKLTCLLVIITVWP